ncbi:MAG TPA: YihY/virulence factor BrkB family protein [Candidatus Limnocylindrales bacterium]|jgi:membrane protein
MPSLPALPNTPAVDFGKRLVTQVMADDVFDLAAGLAYRFLFAIFPFAIFLAALAAYVSGWLGIGDPTSQIIGAVHDNLPPDIVAQLGPQLDAVLGQARPGLLTIGALGALWAATGGIGALQKSLNAAYEVPETRNFFAKTGVAVGLTLLGSAGIVVAFVTIVGGSLLTQEVIRSFGVPPGAWDVVSLARWPLMLLIVAFAVAVLLRFAPNVAVPFRWPMVGGLVFAVGWMVATAGFGLYVANFANYSNTYGALGGVVVLMLWFYLTAVLLLLAAEVTSLLVKDHAPHRIVARQRELGGLPAPGSSEAAKPGAERDARPEDGALPQPSAPSPQVVVVAASRRREPGWTSVLAVLLVLAGVIAGALAGLLTGDRDG